MNDDSLDRVGEIRGELLMIWGRQDPHVPREGRERIHAALEDAGTRFSWLEVNGQHAFGRDEGHRYDPELARQCFGHVLDLFHRRLGQGEEEMTADRGRSRPDTERQATDADWHSVSGRTPAGSPQDRSCPAPTLRGWPHGRWHRMKKPDPTVRSYVADGSACDRGFCGNALVCARPVTASRMARSIVSWSGSPPMMKSYTGVQCSRESPHAAGISLPDSPVGPPPRS